VLDNFGTAALLCDFLILKFDWLLSTKIQNLLLLKINEGNPFLKVAIFG